MPDAGVPRKRQRESGGGKAMGGRRWRREAADGKTADEKAADEKAAAPGKAEGPGVSSGPFRTRSGDRI
ncbi:hypothetical protein GCM10010429_32320 [Micromonospora olivasterospora]